jgi:hypothetical protein
MKRKTKKNHEQIWNGINLVYLHYPHTDEKHLNQRHNISNEMPSRGRSKDIQLHPDL